MDSPPPSPFEISADATETDVAQRLARIAPDGTPAQKVARDFAAARFSCKQSPTKLVCRQQRRVNSFQTEIWILAFDLDEHGRVTARRAKKGYLAP